MKSFLLVLLELLASVLLQKAINIGPILFHYLGKVIGKNRNCPDRTRKELYSPISADRDGTLEVD